MPCSVDSSLAVETTDTKATGLGLDNRALVSGGVTLLLVLELNDLKPI